MLVEYVNKSQMTEKCKEEFFIQYNKSKPLAPMTENSCFDGSVFSISIISNSTDVLIEYLNVFHSRMTEECKQRIIQYHSETLVRSYNRLIRLIRNDGDGAEPTSNSNIGNKYSRRIFKTITKLLKPYYTSISVAKNFASLLNACLEYEQILFNCHNSIET